MLKALEQLIRQAGEIARSQALAAQVHVKGRSDFVTDADLAVSAFLEKELPLLVPGSRVLSEENAHDVNTRHGKVFIIDPIDGTTSLTYHLNLSCVSCGYVVDGEPVMGAVYNPFTDEMFLAEKGKGATLNGRLIQVNEDPDLTQALIGFETGPATANQQETYFKHLYAISAKSKGLRLIGSAALDICYVACGRLSGTVFHYLFPWDFAAGWVILKEAGGKLSLMDGSLPAFEGRCPSMVASNTLLHEELLNAFN